jgi:hypothetical protein
MSKLLEDVSEDTNAVTDNSSPRFSVPEMIAHNRAPDMCTDVWQFASSVLHCFTNEVPYHERKRNGEVIATLTEKKHPARPPKENELNSRWITDEVWKLLVKCWNPEPRKRPPMRDVGEAMKEIERASSRPSPA